jgi:hypothetical protein
MQIIIITYSLIGWILRFIFSASLDNFGSEEINKHHYRLAYTAEFSNGSYTSVSNFTNLGKHWSELKGFALSLQFSPFSPFRDAQVTAVTLDDLKAALTAIGDAPVLATDTQEKIDTYLLAIVSARDTLQLAYGFDAENVAGW